MKTKGISICFGRSNKKWGAYFGKLLAATVRPRINGGKDKCTFGIRFDLVVGPLVRPVARFYKLAFWKGDKTLNPWNGGNHWFMLRIPFVIVPFVSVILGKHKLPELSWRFGKADFRFPVSIDRWVVCNPGFWLGGRTADLSNKVDWQLRTDWSKPNHPSKWAWNEDGSPKEAWPVGKYKGQVVVEPTIAIRKDMRH